MMSILTIYNHGTGGTSLKSANKGEIINLFGNNDPGIPDVTKIITEGVGSKGDPQLHKVTKNDDGTVTHTQSKPSRFANKALRRKMKELTGGGVNQNVQNVLATIEALFEAGKAPNKINMIGWSRGAVTCIRIAYWLYNHEEPWLRTIPVNIFAVDPVAGPTHNNEPDASMVTPNVANYIATLSIDEAGSGFKPMSDLRLTVMEPQHTSWCILPFKGIHRDCAKNDNDAGKITFGLAYRFLNHHGTKAPNMSHYWMSNEECYTKYINLKAGVGGASKRQGFFKALSRGTRHTRDVDASRYVTHEYFCNAHSKALFMREYNAAYQAYFGAGNSMLATPTWASIYLNRSASDLSRLPEDQAEELRAMRPGMPMGDVASTNMRIGTLIKNGLVD